MIQPHSWDIRIPELQLEVIVGVMNGRDVLTILLMANLSKCCVWHPVPTG